MTSLPKMHPLGNDVIAMDDSIGDDVIAGLTGNP